MTCGIYRLVFNGTDRCYIGQSVNIEKRYLSHIRAFESKTQPKKLQKAYELYGRPALDIILDSVDKDQLDSLENEAIEIFDSFNKGFNSLETAGEAPNSPCKGLGHWNSKYSVKQLHDSLKLLLDSSYLLSDIEKVTGVDSITLRRIASGSGHVWLSEEYPELYAKVVEDGKNHRNSYYKKKAILPKVYSPEGTIYTVEHLSNFAKQHKLDHSALSKVLNNKQKTHKGWRVCQEEVV